jgi:cytochrome c oxidase subunit II
MRHARTAAAVLIAFCCSLALPAQETRKITIVAKKYEFTPNRIELKAGEPVELTLQSEDAKHGFVCKDLKTEKVTYDPQNPHTIKFTPEKPGTYEFHCSHFCGFGHSKMKGEFVVSEAGAAQ